jgi:ribokinase
MSKIVVIGSSNTDLIAKVERFPLAGETVTGKFFMQAMGGKGANQALAAHRSGGDVKFVTCWGSDSNGKSMLPYYAQQGLDVSLALQVEDTPTGNAIILVNEEGENVIVITPGANHQLTREYISGLSAEIAKASMIMLQMEIPFDSVTGACELAKRHNIPVLLNVAPARKIDEALVRMVEILVVNETEIETITDQRIDAAGEEAAMDKLLLMGAKTVILTLGKRGCMVKNKTIHHYIPAFEVDTVDSTAAGDTFCGALAAQLSKGLDLVEAIKFATAAAAICVTRIGAQPSIPMESDVRQFLLTHPITRDNGTFKGDGTDKKVIL